MDTIGFEGIAEFLTQHQAQATADLTRYFTTYTGRWFEYFSRVCAPQPGSTALMAVISPWSAC